MGSLQIVVVALLCVGGVVVLNAASQFRRFGETVLTGDAVSLALLRELGPVFTALLVAGRNATGMASELGSMVVTEQVDAIRGLGIDPIRKLMTPRVARDGVNATVARGGGGLCGTARRIPGRKRHTSRRCSAVLDTRHQCAGFRRPLHQASRSQSFSDSLSQPWVVTRGCASKAGQREWAAPRLPHSWCPPWWSSSWICFSLGFCFTSLICDILRHWRDWMGPRLYSVQANVTVN